VKNKKTILRELISMSRSLGRPEKRYAILGEGNTSARIDAETFFVKASGAQLGEADEGAFVEVKASVVLEALEHPEMSDDEVRRMLEQARVNTGDKARPSVETVLHAHLYNYEGINFVAHTHPTEVCKLLCSQRAEELTAGALFPDGIVACGPRPGFVPCVDPGVPLAVEVRRRVEDFADREGELPRVILLQNHGMIALGATAQTVEAITDTYVKIAEVILGACLAGGPRFLAPREVRRIHTRPDEAYRRRFITPGGDE